MGKSSAPEPPDPQETAGAQTANNIGTAIANQALGNVNQVTPTGSLMYSQSGTQSWTDPNTGEVYEIPMYTATTGLSNGEQAIFDAEQASRLSLAQLGQSSAARMNDHLGQSMDFGSLPQGGSASNMTLPQYQSISGLGQLNTSLGDAGNIQTGVGSRANELVRNYQETQFNGDIADAGSVAREFGDAGDITRTYNTDFSEDRRRVEEALMSRLNPSISQDTEALRTSLLNQGIREGSEAFDRAMNRANQQSTDARMQAILAGGQEQSRMVGLEAERARFQNSAQNQSYNQELGRGMFANNAQQQVFGQNNARAQLQFNQQAATAQERAARANFQNAATQAAFGQDLASGQFANAAQQQQFGQNLAAGQFANAAIAGNNDTAFNQANFNNNIIDRGFANDQYMQNRMDQDRQNATQEMLMARNQPINELGALLGTGQVQMPHFINANTPQMATVDRAGLEQSNYANQLNAWNQQQATMGGLLGTAGQIGGALLMGSDRRAKTDVKRVGMVGRLPAYTYRYKGGKRVNVGFMADEVMDVRPDAVVWKDGFAMVDYGKALEAA